MTKTPEENGSTRTVERALALLAVVCESGQLSLSEAARETNLAVSTALRLLRTLEQAGFVVRDNDGNYRAGARVIQIGAQALSDQALVSLAAGAMEDLVQATGESAYLSVPGHRDTALYLAITEGTHPVRHVSWVGRTVPLDGSAVGAVMGGRTPAIGYVVVESGVEPDVTAIAAPIMLRGRVVAAISLLVPSYRADAAKVASYGSAVVEAAGRVSERLGG
ncbi:MAG: IclR family transcriptional regulator [Bifidobacteriaceae bacterium]|jgi:DNA-binding IclR family transcriptional regulator|nr:IclR family transcriptional regulator [Bifidobacteriaceae bacterium]